MAWRVVTVAQKSYLSLRDNNLNIKQDDEEYRIPLEDVGALLVENKAVTLSAALLDACIQNKVALYVCDEKHLPSGSLLAYQQHSRQGKVIKGQINWSEPFKKRLWQRLIVQKIENQRNTVEKLKGKEYPQFQNLIATVKSGDTSNRESVAAQFYFSELLPQGHNRGSKHIYNSALNYGYAILRGAVARSLVAYGFLSSLGIQHRNQLDNYALADDIIEPFRPSVDFMVFKDIPGDEAELTKEMRDILVGILNQKVKIGGSSHRIMRAIELSAQSLVTATEEKDPTCLLLPETVYE